MPQESLQLFFHILTIGVAVAAVALGSGFHLQAFLRIPVLELAYVRGHVGVLGHSLGDFAVEIEGCDAEFGGIEGEVQKGLEPADQGESRLGIRRRRDVMGDVGPEADRGESRAAAGVVEHADDTGWAFVP